MQVILIAEAIKNLDELQKMNLAQSGLSNVRSLHHQRSGHVGNCSDELSLEGRFVAKSFAPFLLCC